MIKPPRKWTYIFIELEIDGVVIESNTATQVTFEKIYNKLLYEGQTQRLPWAIFISKSYYRKPRIINSGINQDRDSNGIFIKPQTLNHENERP